MNKNTLINDCIQYILLSEADDYFQWCIDEGRDAEKYSSNTMHIYAAAIMALESNNE